MRWIRDPQPSSGDVRVISRFLWVPLELRDEIRWFEFARVKQVYLPWFGWISTQFIDSTDAPT